MNAYIWAHFTGVGHEFWTQSLQLDYLIVRISLGKSSLCKKYLSHFNIINLLDRHNYSMETSQELKQLIFFVIAFMTPCARIQISKEFSWVSIRRQDQLRSAASFLTDSIKYVLEAVAKKRLRKNVSWVLTNVWIYEWMIATERQSLINSIAAGCPAIFT